MYILRASWKISYYICIYVCAKCCHPQKIKSLLTYLLTYLQPEEIKDIEIRLIKSAQREHFQSEFDAIKSGREISSKSKLVGLKPLIDNDELLRCNSRLQYAEHMSYEARFPIILPEKVMFQNLL